MTTTMQPYPRGVVEAERERHIADRRAAWLNAQSRERAYYALLAETDGTIDHAAALRLHCDTHAALRLYFAAMGVEL